VSVDQLTSGLDTTRLAATTPTRNTNQIDWKNTTNAGFDDEIEMQEHDRQDESTNDIPRTHVEITLRSDEDGASEHTRKRRPTKKNRKSTGLRMFFAKRVSIFEVGSGSD
jgi:hypothetical protein